MPLRELCQELLIIAASLTSLPAPEECPPVALVDETALNIEVCGRSACGVEAFFNRETHSIALNDRLDLERVYARSILLHELVHFLQDYNVAWKPGCQAGLNRELDAFIAQENYLRANGNGMAVSHFVRRYVCQEDVDEKQTASRSD